MSVSVTTRLARAAVSRLLQPKPSGPLLTVARDKHTVTGRDVNKYKAGAKYGGWHMVTMLPGSGIGPELMGYIRELFRYSSVPVMFEMVEVDPNAEDINALENVICALKRNGAGIKGNIETKSLDANIISRNIAIRNELDLYVYVIHCRGFPGVKARYSDLDFFVIRQNTEGEYSNMEHESVDGVVECLKIITESNSERIARYAFEFAKKNNRAKVTTIHKANIMKLSDGLFLEVARAVAKEYPDIEHNDMIIDNCCMQLVSNPQQFDVMLMPNLYGAIVSNVCCGLIGGAGLLSGCNYGDQYAIFEPATRNTGSPIAGKDIANPISMINASIDLLRHLGLTRHSKLFQAAVHHALIVEKVHTQDLGGMATSSDVMKSIMGFIKDNQIKALQS